MRNEKLPYGRQSIDEEDIDAVISALRSDWLTTGPAVEIFEQAVASFVGAKHGVAVSSGTAALHAAMYALRIGPGDEVIVPPITFAATANAAVYLGATPVFADVVPGNLLLDPAAVERKISARTKVIACVDYAGHPCNYSALRGIAAKHGLRLLADGCHALGALFKGNSVGTLADLTIFSFHPVKHITTGEGGMVVTNDAAIAANMRTFRNHGIDTDHIERARRDSWVYEMVDLGYNYRITDFQCALGVSQLRKLPQWLARRRDIAARYDAAFAGSSAIRALYVEPEVAHAYHLYVVQIEDRERVFHRMRERGIGVNVHYIPVYFHPFYRNRFETGPGLCPIAEAAYERIISLPIFPGMTDDDTDRVISEITDLTA